MTTPQDHSGPSSESPQPDGAAAASAEPLRPRGRSRRGPALAVILLLLGVGGIWGRPSARSARWLHEAQRAQQRGEIAQAESAAAQAFLLDDSNAAAGLLAAELAAEQGELARAVSLAAKVRQGDVAIQLRAILFQARTEHYRRKRFLEAEQVYREALLLDPDNTGALWDLVELLCLCGRRREAIPHILKQVELGGAVPQLVLLARESGAVSDPDLLAGAREAAPRDPMPLIGLARELSEQQRHEDALKLLRRAVDLYPGLDAAESAMGRQFLTMERFDELHRWVLSRGAEGLQSPEAWYLRGRLAEHLGLSDGALCCYHAAMVRGLDLKAAILHAVRLLAQRNQLDRAPDLEPYLARLQTLEDVQNRVLFSGAPVAAPQYLELARAYDDAGRRWEARGWLQLALEQAPDNAELRAALEDARRRTEGLPLDIVPAQDNPAEGSEFLGRLRLPNYPPTPPLVPNRTEISSPPPQRAPHGLSFRDDASVAGLDFRYAQGIEGETRRRMFEFTGGGIGVLDYDMDGWPDVFCSQGSRRPPGEGPSELSDALFRNLGGTRLLPVAGPAGLAENRFGQGVSAGDLNSDGFPDLYVANIGVNQLWLNLGDGRFQPLDRPAAAEDQSWTTSCLTADLNDDGHPDLYDVNYLQGDDVLERVCRRQDGAAVMCMPYEFEPAPDRCWISDGAGGFTEESAGLFSPPPLGRGLGVLAWSPAADGRLALFIANDTTASFLYLREPENSPAAWEERAIPAGVAFNGDGKATGCMGVATADLDDDGLLDLVVTNFLMESNSVFLQRDRATFEDQSRRLGMHAASLDLLAFGAQFLDADLDGRPELFITNGHVDDLRRYDRPYAMRPQLLVVDDGRFLELPGDSVGPYFKGEWLGRSVARLDWNRDGRDDLLVGALQSPTALLTNASSSRGRFVALQLVGRESPRRPVGAVAVARVGDRASLHPLTAGDGYQASNEPKLVIGVGDAEHVDSLEVRWPSGAVQTFSNVASNQGYLLVEGRELRREATSESPAL